MPTIESRRMLLSPALSACSMSMRTFLHIYVRQACICVKICVNSIYIYIPSRDSRTHNIRI